MDGLRHTWGDGDCSDDDFCGDTPATDGPNYGCPTNQNTCPTSSPDMVENYMEYTDDDCMNIFTTCQKTRMRTVMANSPRRAVLLNSLVCSGQVAPVADFSVNQREVCAGSRLQYQARRLAPAAGHGPSREGPRLRPPSKIPRWIISRRELQCTLTVSNSIGSDSETKSGWITVTDNGPNVFYVEDFEGGLNGWSISNPDQFDTWQLVDVSGQASGDRAMYVNLYYYTNTGQRDGLTSPSIDISTHDNVSLSFDYAYRQFSADDQDSLIVYVSTDGGNTFPHKIFADSENGSKNFATGEILTSNFVPAFSVDWCHSGTDWGSCPELDLSPYSSTGSIVLRFETYNDYGNNIFIDNIQLQGTCQPVQVSLEETVLEAFN